MEKLLILKYQFKNNWKTLVRQLITQRVSLVQKDLFQIAKKKIIVAQKNGQRSRMEKEIQMTIWKKMINFIHH